MFLSFHDLIDDKLHKLKRLDRKSNLASILQSKNVPRATSFRIQSSHDRGEVFSKAQIGYLERALLAEKVKGRLTIPNYYEFSTTYLSSFLSGEFKMSKGGKCLFCQPNGYGLPERDYGAERFLCRYIPSNHVQKKPSPLADYKSELEKAKTEYLSQPSRFPTWRVSSILCCPECLDINVEVLAMDYPSIVSFLLKKKYTQIGLAKLLGVKQSYISKLKNSDFEAISPYMTSKNATELHRRVIELKLTEIGQFIRNEPKKYLNQFLTELKKKGYEDTSIHWEKLLPADKRKKSEQTRSTFNSNILIRGKNHSISCYFAHSPQNVFTHIPRAKKNSSRYLCLLITKGKDWQKLCVDLDMWPIRFCEIPENYEPPVSNLALSLNWNNFLKLNAYEKLKILNNHESIDEANVLKTYFNLIKFEQILANMIKLNQEEHVLILRSFGLRLKKLLNLSYEALADLKLMARADADKALIARIGMNIDEIREHYFKNKTNEELSKRILSEASIQNQAMNLFRKLE